MQRKLKSARTVIMWRPPARSASLFLLDLAQYHWYAAAQKPQQQGQDGQEDAGAFLGKR